jgi:hypothetical protein
LEKSYISIIFDFDTKSKFQIQTRFEYQTCFRFEKRFVIKPEKIMSNQDFPEIPIVDINDFILVDGEDRDCCFYTSEICLFQESMDIIIEANSYSELTNDEKFFFRLYNLFGKGCGEQNKIFKLK